MKKIMLYMAILGAVITGSRVYGDPALKITPKSIFQKDFWGDYVELVSYWQPLDWVELATPSHDILRVISYGGWEGTWSVTVFKIKNSDAERSKAKGDEFSICYLYRIIGDAKSTTIIKHQSELGKSDAVQLFNEQMLGGVFDGETSDLNKSGVRMLDQATFIIERLGPKGYQLVIRGHGIEGEVDVSSIIKLSKSVVQRVFRSELERMPIRMKE